MSKFLLPGSSTQMLPCVELGALVGVPGAVARERIQVLLAHRTARDLALACCWIKHRRRPGTELSIVLEEHPGWGGEIAESKMGCRMLNRQGTGVELPRALEHWEAQDAALLGVVGGFPVLVERHRCPRPGMVEYFIPREEPLRVRPSPRFQEGFGTRRQRVRIPSQINGIV